MNCIGLVIFGIIFDIMLVFYLLNLFDLIDDFISVVIWYDYIEVEIDEVVYGKGVKCSIFEESIVVVYLVRKVVVIVDLEKRLVDDLEENE